MIDIVLDSSVIIGLSRLTLKHIKYPRNKSELPYFEILELIEKENINVIIPQTIYKEIERWRDLDKRISHKFFKKYCKVFKLTKQEKDFSMHISKNYSTLTIDGQPAIPLAKNITQKNYRDSHIIAEISIIQNIKGKKIPFITNNFKDVKDVKRINTINNFKQLPEIFICPLSRYMDAIMFAKREDKEHTL